MSIIQIKLEDRKASHPLLVEVSRLLKEKTRTRQFLMTVKGDPFNSLDQGNWGTNSLRTHIAEPIRCFKC